MRAAVGSADDVVDLISRSADNIHEAIHEIRNISRSLVPTSISDLGLRDSINDLVENIRITRDIHVEFFTGDQIEGKINDKLKLMLFRVIQEQVNNILKHSAAKNLTIELTLEEGDSSIGLTITDDGKGIDAEALPRVFEPFFSTKIHHRGLGLAWVYGIITNHRGGVAVSSEPKRGTSVRIMIPLHERR